MGTLRLRGWCHLRGQSVLVAHVTAKDMAIMDRGTKERTTSVPTETPGRRGGSHTRGGVAHRLRIDLTSPGKLPQHT